MRNSCKFCDQSPTITIGANDKKKEPEPMQRIICAMLLSSVLASLSGCASSPRPRPGSEFSVRFTSPEEVAGKTEYVSDNLRVRLTEARGQPSLNEQVPVVLCVIEIENTRDVWARIDADRSCLIDPKFGAISLLWRDKPIPAECWTRVVGVAPGLININLNLLGWVTNPQRLIGGTQRLLLNMIWDDEITETVDLTYEVKAKSGPAE